MNLKQRIKVLEEAMGTTTPHFVIIHPGDEDAEEKIAAARALHGDNLIIVRINIVKPNTSQG